MKSQKDIELEERRKSKRKSKFKKRKEEKNRKKMEEKGTIHKQTKVDTIDKTERLNEEDVSLEIVELTESEQLEAANPDLFTEEENIYWYNFFKEKEKLGPAIRTVISKRQPHVSTHTSSEDW